MFATLIPSIDENNGVIDVEKINILNCKTVNDLEIFYWPNMVNKHRCSFI